MQQLHLVGFTADNRGLIFSARKGSKSGGFVVTLDDKLLARVDEIVARRELEAQEEQSSGRPKSSLSPREIQARLRAGRTIAQVAREADVDEEWVARWAAPILAEQAQVVERAQELTMEKARIGPSAVPLGEAVRWNMADKGIVFTDAGWSGSWDAFHLRGNSWMVRFTYVYRKATHQAEWEVETRDAVVISRNRQATELGFVAPGRRRPKMPRSMLAAVDLPSVAPALPAASSGTGANSPSGSAEKKPAPRASAKKKAPAGKDVAARTAAAKKKWAAIKKAADRKAAADRVAARKAAAKRAAEAKKEAERKAAAKKAAAQKAAAARASKKRAAPKKAAKKTAVKKSAAKKSAANKAGGKKTAVKKSTARKAAVRKSAARKATPKKTAARKSTPRKAVPRKATRPTRAAPRRAAVPAPAVARPRPSVEPPRISSRQPAGSPPRPTNRPAQSASARPTRRTAPRTDGAEAARIAPAEADDDFRSARDETGDRRNGPEPAATRTPIRIDSGVPRRTEGGAPPIIRADRADQSRDEPAGVGPRSTESSGQRPGRFRFRRGRNRN